MSYTHTYIHTYVYRHIHTHTQHTYIHSFTVLPLQLKKEQVHLHPDLKFRTYLSDNGDHTNISIHIHSFIHSGHFYSAPSSLLLHRGAPDYSTDTAHSTAEIVAEIINSSFETGQIHPDLKKGKITPIFKQGDRENMSIHRPISILSFFAKIMEKAMSNRLTNYIEKIDSNTISSPVWI